MSIEGGDEAVVSFVDYGDKRTVPFSSIRKLPRLLEHIPFMALQCKLAAVHLDHWPRKAIDVMKEICPAEQICRAVFRSQSDNLIEVDSLFIDDINVVDKVLASLVHPDHLDASSESTRSPDNNSLYIPPARVEAQFCLIQVKAESDSMETGPDGSEESNFLPLE